MGSEIFSSPIIFTVPCGILTFLFGIFSGGILISLFSMFLGRIRKIKFYEKLSTQILRMSFSSLWVFLILTILYFCSLIKFFKLNFQFSQIKKFFLKNLFVQIDFSTILLAIFLFTFFFLLKNFLKKSSGLYIFILTIINILLWIGIYGALFIKFNFKETWILDIKGLFFPKDIFFVLCFWSYFFLAIGVSSLYSSFYLMIRRNKDDYGRDYYKFAIPACGRWSFGLIFFLLGLFSMTFIYFQNIPLFRLEILAGLLITIIVSLILNYKLIKSEHPARLKEIMVLNPVLSLIINILFVMQSSGMLWNIS